MKKLISTILALTFVLAALSALTPSISAKSATISEREARELVERAYQFFCDARVDDWDDNLVDYKSEDICEIYISHIDETLIYRPVDESKLPGGSYSAMREAAKEIYTEKIAELAYQFSGASPGGVTHNLPMYHIAESGKVYGYGLQENSSHNLYIYTPSLQYNRFSEGEVQLSNISGDSKSATALITMSFHWADGPRSSFCEAVECKFENTSRGWRIAESEFSLLLSSSKTVLDDYRKDYPEKVNPEVLKLTDAEAKYVVDEAVMDYLIEMYCGYYERYLDYVKREHKEVKEIAKEITDPDGSKSIVKYVEDRGIDEYAAIYFTDDVAESFMTKAYHNNDLDMFITEGDTDYLAYIDGADDLSFVYDPEDVVVEVVESTDKEATARVYCGLKKDGKIIPIYVECKFEKGYERWYIAESDFVDMLNSADRFEYTVGEAPSTGDNAFDAIAICLGGMALVMSVIALIPRKKREAL